MKYIGISHFGEDHTLVMRVGCANCGFRLRIDEEISFNFCPSCGHKFGERIDGKIKIKDIVKLLNKEGAEDEEANH